MASLNAAGRVRDAELGRGERNGVASLGAGGTIPAEQIGGVLPVGTIVDYGGPNVPAGWFACTGGAISRSQNAALFAVIGTTWGAGNGSTTFNLPDLRRRATIGAGGARPNGSDGPAPQLGETGGAETHTLTEDEMPEHDHTVRGGAANDGSQGSYPEVTPTRGDNISTDDAGGGAPHNNMPPSAVVQKIIKAT